MDLVQNEPRAGIVPCIDAVQIFSAVSAALPRQTIQVDRIRDAKILKRAQEPPIDRIRQPNLGTCPPAKPMQDIKLIGSLRCRS